MTASRARGGQPPILYSRSHFSGGFTLIELLLGSIVSAILLAALYAVFQGALQSQTHATTGLEDVVPRGQIIALIKSDIENMAAPNSLLCGNVLGQHEGDADHCSDQIEFSTTSGKISDALPWGEVQTVDYYLEPADTDLDDSVPKGNARPKADSVAAGSGLGRFKLVRAVTRNLLAVDVEDEQETTTLLDAVQSLAFEYYDGQVWLPAWDSTTLNNALPKAVRVRITFPTELAKGMATAPIEVVCEVAAQNPARNDAVTTAPATGAKG